MSESSAGVVMQKLITGIIGLTLLIVLAGCASPWEKNYQPNAALDQKFPPSAQVEVRMVEFDRLANYEQAEKKLRRESATSPADYTAEQRRAAKDRLLEAL